jgi:hypothetical protein
MLTYGVVFLRDNARPHTTAHTRAFPTALICLTSPDDDCMSSKQAVNIVNLFRVLYTLSKTTAVSWRGGLCAPVTHSYAGGNLGSW